ncbi:MAG: cyclopropane fatty acyl phospholipid synthase [Candidatus Melainabacteria bacterium]|jgi:cyclopropane-fatty-acyl-phospholipid synthase
MNNAQEILEDILSQAGIEINGDNPWDIKVNNKAFFNRVLAEGSTGLGESYVDGWWDCPHLDQFFDKILRADIQTLFRNKWPNILFHRIPSLLFNMQSRSRARIVGEVHYNKGNDLYQLMLDKRMTYTGAYWQNTHTLDQAQEAKLELICQKLNLKSGQTVLDIGCGWGSFAKYAAEKYNANIVGITISEEQVKLGNQLCKGLPVELRLQDYRELKGKFDHIVSIGMFEHVGYKNYRTYFEVAKKLLKENGLFVLQTIGSNKSVTHLDPWMSKHIFPNGMLPSIKQIGQATEKLMLMEDFHNFGADYDKTLMAWYFNFKENWYQIKDQYDERFFRMWNYYLLSCAGAFRARKIQLWQMVFSPKGVSGVYTRDRHVPQRQEFAMQT